MFLVRNVVWHSYLIIYNAVEVVGSGPALYVIMMVRGMAKRPANKGGTGRKKDTETMK